MIITLIGLLASSFVLCSFLTPVARALARRYDLVDHPDGRRKIHSRAIPVAGGLAVFFSGLLTLVFALTVANPLRQHLQESGTDLVGLLLAAIVICVVGV